MQGNLVGTRKDGITALGNDGDDVLIGSGDNSVGDFSPSAANTIAFNEGTGVKVVGDDSIRNRVLANSIFSNKGLGIDLAGGVENAAGATGNDPGDLDEGPNDLQNKPTLTSAVTSGRKTTVGARLGSTPSDPFLIQFFSNPPDNEGKKFIGSKSVSTDANGGAVFKFVAPQRVQAGQRITATATDVVGANTSEFSAPRAVVAR